MISAGFAERHSGVPAGNHIDLELPKEAFALPRSARRRQILALSGGGYRGLYSAAFLAHAEDHFGCHTGTQFDLLAGTSIGGLIGAALALDIGAESIVGKIIQHGPLIFRRLPLLTKTRQLWFRAPYSAETLKAAVIDTIGLENANRSLTEVEKPLAICAVNYTHGSPKIFRSRGLAG